MLLWNSITIEYLLTQNTKHWHQLGKKCFSCKYYCDLQIIYYPVSKKNTFYAHNFCSDVKDIHDVLEITVFDEDKDHKYEFLGKVVIPLLRIKNSDKRWYMLKDKKLRGPAKGEQPQILLEMFFVYNKIRASIRTFNPKQLKYEDRSDIKFKHSVFMKNVNRVKAATADFDPEVVLREIQ